MLVISDSINWQNNNIFVDNDKDKWNILSFENACNCTMNNLLIYFYETEIFEITYVDEIELVSEKNEVVNKEISNK